MVRGGVTSGWLTSSGCSDQLLDDLTSGRVWNFTSDNLNNTCVPWGHAAVSISCLRDCAVATTPPIEQVLRVRAWTEQCRHGQYLPDPWRLSCSGQLDDLLEVSQAVERGYGVECLRHSRGKLEDFVLVPLD